MFKFFKDLFKSNKCFCGKEKLVYEGKICSDYCFKHEMSDFEKSETLDTDDLMDYRIQE